MSLCMYAHAYSPQHSSECQIFKNTICEHWLVSYHVRLEDETQVVRLCGRILSILSHLTVPSFRLHLSFVTFTWSHFMQSFHFNYVLVTAIHVFIIVFPGRLAESVLFILFCGSTDMWLVVQNFWNRFLKIIKISLI